MKGSINIIGLSLCVIVMGAFGFIIAEPSIVKAIEDQFTISQTITSEISFLTPASDITMSPSIAGVTGGTSNGSTQVIVLTNDSAGYTMTIKASSSAGMLGNSQGGTIPVLVPASPGIPDFAFTSGTLADNTAAFAYTVEASTTADLDPSFMDNGSTCSTGASDAVDSCWLNATTTQYTIINRTSETTAFGATTTIKFRVVVRSSPSPALPEDVYVATTTLTATTN